MGADVVGVAHDLYHACLKPSSGTSGIPVDSEKKQPPVIKPQSPLTTLFRRSKSIFQRRLTTYSVEKLQIFPDGKFIYTLRFLNFNIRGESQSQRSLPTELLVSLHTSCYEKFMMVWFFAEKQSSIFIEFFNSIDPNATLGAVMPALEPASIPKT
jgi:hypothetical protein